MSPLLVIAVLGAGAAGAILRYATGLLMGRVRARLPWAVLVVNVAGSLTAGVMIGLAQVEVIPPDLEVVLLTGFAGGLTTFSTLSVETVQLMLEGRWRTAVDSIAANVLLGIAAATAGWLLGSLAG